MATNMKKKAERVEEKREKRPYAVAKYLRISPYKVRMVLDLIRGRSVEEAEAILSNITNGGALPTKKVLMSAVANAEHNQGMDRGDLYVAECYANILKENATRQQRQGPCDFKKNEPYYGHP